MIFEFSDWETISNRNETIRKKLSDKDQWHSRQTSTQIRKLKLRSRKCFCSFFFCIFYARIQFSYSSITGKKTTCQTYMHTHARQESIFQLNGYFIHPGCKFTMIWKNAAMTKLHKNSNMKEKRSTTENQHKCPHQTSQHTFYIYIYAYTLKCETNGARLSICVLIYEWSKSKCRPRSFYHCSIELRLLNAAAFSMEWNGKAWFDYFNSTVHAITNH